jgi:hypothetical protein
MKKGILLGYRSHVILFILMVSVTLVCWGCYPKGVGPMGTDGKKLTWPEMNQPQRRSHMKNVILPRAAELFGDWRPERFANVDCSLCHGIGQITDNFKMPTAHLPKLSGELLLGPEFEKHPETTRLKLNRLVPMMAESLGLKPFNLVTRTGFGCYSCHLGPTGAMFGS